MVLGDGFVFERKVAVVLSADKRQRPRQFDRRAAMNRQKPKSRIAHARPFPVTCFLGQIYDIVRSVVSGWWIVLSEKAKTERKMKRGKRGWSDAGSDFPVRRQPLTAVHSL
jgi:hypothetical protein